LYKSLQIFSTRGWRYQKRPAEKAVSTALGGPEKGGRERERVLSSTVCPSRPASSAAYAWMEEWEGGSEGGERKSLW